MTSRAREIAEEIIARELDDFLGNNIQEMLKQNIEQALLQYGREEREKALREAAEIANKAGREGKDWIKNEIFSLIQKTEKCK